MKTTSSQKKNLADTAGGTSPGEAAEGRESLPPCPVVGVGASAGGVEAFTELLKHLPHHTGFAFALVQHLDPNSGSHLSQILSRATPMPVTEVTDGIHLEPDHVYVIPPNASMSVSDGSLSLGPRPEGRERHLPIDHFFQSLALNRGNRAIGVVLSGNAFDGTLGLQAIKSAGGITFAQDESTAKFPGMPRNAASGGFVDFVLPPKKIAGELARLGANTYITAGNDETSGLPKGEGLKKIFALLRAASGVDFSNYRQTTIQRRIQRRLTVQRAEGMDDYLKFVEKNPDEIHALFRDILIHVTNFFREPESFASLATHVFPELVKNRRVDDPLRVWLPGCSTGEEAYSLAIALVEFLGDRFKGTPIQIFGTDVSEKVIETARKGVYGMGIEADVSPDRLRRFFTKVERGYQINKSIRDLCVFARQNVVKDPPFSKLDLISCRNVLIYFEPGRALILGSAETISSFGDLFTVVDQKNKIFMKRGDAPPAAPPVRLFDDLPPAPGDPRESGGGAPPREPVWSRFDVHKEADRILMAKYCPPALVIDDAMEIIQFRGEVAPYLDPAPGEASLNLFKMTQAAFGAELRRAVLAARKSGAPVRKQGIPVEKWGQSHKINLEVVRMDAPAIKERCFIIIFEDAPSAAPAPLPEHEGPAQPGATFAEEELAAAREHLQSLIEEHETTNEELRSANEEIQSSNEELQSTNEELETAKEELQSTNEELTTLNEELKQNNRDLNDLNDDLNNLLRSVNIPVIMLDRDLRIRRFTPGAQKVFKLIPTDIGRAISDIKAEIDVPDLDALVREVIESLSVKELELRDRHDRWHRLQVRPFETMDNRIAGAVLILFNIDAARRIRDRLKHAANFANAIVETCREPLLVLDRELRVKRMTRAFRSRFCADREIAEGEFFYEICDSQWNIPALLSLLEEVLSKDARVDDFKVEQVFSTTGRKTVLLNARCVEAVYGEEPSIVLSITETQP